MPNEAEIKRQNLESFRLRPSTFCLSAFTLIEILVALAIAAVAFSAVLQSQLQTLKVEQQARLLQVFRFETERIFAVTQRARDERQLMELLATGAFCSVKSEPLKLEQGTNKIAVIRHALAAREMPSLSADFFTRVPGYRADPGRFAE